MKKTTLLSGQTRPELRHLRRSRYGFTGKSQGARSAAAGCTGPTLTIAYGVEARAIHGLSVRRWWRVAAASGSHMRLNNVDKTVPEWIPCYESLALCRSGRKGARKKPLEARNTTLSRSRLERSATKSQNQKRRRRGGIISVFRADNQGIGVGIAPVTQRKMFPRMAQVWAILRRRWSGLGGSTRTKYQPDP